MILQFLYLYLYKQICYEIIYCFSMVLICILDWIIKLVFFFFHGTYHADEDDNAAAGRRGSMTRSSSLNRRQIRRLVDRRHSPCMHAGRARDGSDEHVPVFRGCIYVHQGQFNRRTREEQSIAMHHARAAAADDGSQVVAGSQRSSDSRPSRLDGGGTASRAPGRPAGRNAIYIFDWWVTTQRNSMFVVLVTTARTNSCSIYSPDP